MKTIVCPNCFNRSEVGGLAWGCSNPDCSREMLPTTIKNARAPHCQECSKPMSIRFCQECGFPVPAGRTAGKSLPISVVGSEGSGKSNYLAVLINEIRHLAGKAYDFSLYPLGGDDTMLQYQNEYYKPLYEQRSCITSTQQDIVRPMVYSMVFNDKTLGRNATLTFYDACGANFRSERVMQSYNRSIYNSKGILFLVDPTQLPGLREQFIAQGKPVLEDDFSALLSRTIQLIRQGTQQQDLESKIKIPIAVCISKLDKISSKLDAASYLHYPSRHLKQSAFDTIDFETVNYEVQALIDMWAGADLINQVKSQFEHCGFFALSALGSQPGEQGEISHIVPHRVSDPFLWLLAQNDIIKSGVHSRTK